jgi:CheY-like chemotaxis protein
MPLILVIDDDPQMRATVRRILASAGHTVVEAANGREGLTAVRSGVPDVVITDIVMPEMEGIETIIELRRLNPGLRILAISGSFSAGGADFLPMAGRLGADRVMQKPFRAAALQEAVHELVAAAAKDSENPA